ncbi:MAG: hypothetical protein AAB886_01250 [Patescibacteria group bacterium]
MRADSWHLHGAKKAENPYYKRTDEGIQVKLWLVCAIGLGALFILLILRFFPGLWIYEAKISEGMNEEEYAEAKKMVNIWLEGYSFMVFPRKSRLFIETDILKNNLSEAFSEYAFILRVADATLNILPDKKTVAYYVLHEDLMYAISDDGTMLKELDDMERIKTIMDAEQNKIVIIADERPNEELNGPLFRKALGIFNEIKNGTMLSPTGIRIDSTGNRIDIKTVEGPQIYFSMEKPIDSQLKKLSSFLEKRLVDLAELKYIDARFTNRLYYQ